MNRRDEPSYIRPSALRGLARLLDPTGQISRRRWYRVNNISDADAILSDWYAVGDTLREAIQQFDKEINTEADG